MTPLTATKLVSVDTTGADELRMVAAGAGDDATCDHADWAVARLTLLQRSSARPRQA